MATPTAETRQAVTAPRKTFPAPDFIVTGVMRAGTTYTASLFSALGCPCNHEAVFNYDALRRSWFSGRLLGTLLGLHARREYLMPAEVDIANRPPGAAPWGEASWLAAPYLDRFPAGTLILHQVRDPIRVIRSIVRPGPQAGASRRTFIGQHCPASRRGNHLERMMLYWAEWNRLAAQAEHMPHLRYVRYRLEDLTPALLEHIVGLIGFRCRPALLQSVLAAHPRDTNTRGWKGRDWQIGWETLPGGEARQRLAGVAREYGYLGS